MGRKKIIGSNSQATEACEVKPFCYYCDREFDSTKTLIQHQRTKHLACTECGLKFDTVTGLRVHMLNAYKKPMKEVPGAIPGRENPDIVVHGMEGIPKSIIEEKTKKILEERAEKDKLEKARLEKERSERPTPPPEPQSREPPKQKEEPRRSSSPAPEERSKNRKQPEINSVPPPEAPAPPVPPAPALALAPAPPPEAQAQAPVLIVQQPLASMMPGLSLGVQKLLLSVSSRDGNSDNAVSVPALPGRTVPGKLAGLHSVALQVLAAAGVLSLGKGGFAAPRIVEKRPVPGSETLGLGVFPALGFPTFPAGALTVAMGTLGTQVAAGTMGFDAKRPRIEGPGMVLPVMP